MFGWGKSTKKAENAAKTQPAENAIEQELNTPAPADTPVHNVELEAAAKPEVIQAPVVDKPASKDESEPAAKAGFFARIKAGLSRTRSGLADGLGDLLLGKKEIDVDLLEEIETQLIMADTGVAATQEIISELTARASRNEYKDSGALYEALKVSLTALLETCQASLEIPN